MFRRKKMGRYQTWHGQIVSCPTCGGKDFTKALRSFQGRLRFNIVLTCIECHNIQLFSGAKSLQKVEKTADAPPPPSSSNRD